MGEIRRYQCQCGYHMDFFEGAGMRAIKMSAAQQLFSEEFNKLHIQEEALEKVFSDNVLAECPQCKELRTAARCTYTKKAEEHSEILVKESCPECKTTMRILQNKDEILCPKCQNVMESYLAGHWD